MDDLKNNSLGNSHANGQIAYSDSYDKLRPVQEKPSNLALLTAGWRGKLVPNRPRPLSEAEMQKEAEQAKAEMLCLRLLHSPTRVSA